MGEGQLDLSRVPDSKVESRWRRQHWLRMGTMALLVVPVGFLFVAMVISAVDPDAIDKRGPGALGPSDASDGGAPEARDVEPSTLGPDHTALLLFFPSTPEATLRRIEREWQVEPRLQAVSHLTSAEAEEATGFSSPAIFAFVDDEDVNDVRTFVCGYAADPDVSSAAVDEGMCPDPSEPAVPIVQVLLTFAAEATPVEVGRIRNEVEAEDDLIAVVLVEAGELATDNSSGISGLVAFGDVEDQGAIEQFACELTGYPEVARVVVDERCADTPNTRHHPSALTPNAGSASIIATIRAGADPGHVAEIEAAFRRDGVFHYVWRTPSSGPLSVDRLFASGNPGDSTDICEFGRRYADDPAFVEIESTAYGCGDL